MVKIRVKGIRQLNFIDTKGNLHQIKSSDALPYEIDEELCDHPYLYWHAENGFIEICPHEQEGYVPEVTAPEAADKGAVPVWDASGPQKTAKAAKE